MADSELDKMRLSAMLNSTPSSGGLNVTNTRTPSFSMNTPLEQLYSNWMQQDRPLQRTLRGEQVTKQDWAKDIAQAAEESIKHPEGFIGSIGGEGETLLNLKPRISADKLKGPDLQPAQNFINQSKSLRGVTKEGHDFGTNVVKLIDPDTVMAKQDFVDNLRPNQYKKVDLKTAHTDDVMQHLYDEAHDAVHDVDVYRRMRLPADAHNAVQQIIFADHRFEALPQDLQETFTQRGLTNEQQIHDAYFDTRDELVHEIANELFLNTNAGNVPQGEYRYPSYQRLVPKELTGNKYFEIGVTHPNQEGAAYKHYQNIEDPDGLIGHARGTIITEPTPLVTGSRNQVWTNPGDAVIEEIQADAQKNAEQVDHLHQVHGTITKAAIQHALENGARTIYIPTSRAIGAVRGTPGGEYGSIYDSQVLKEAINPLKEMEGVAHTPPTQTSYSHPWTGASSTDAYNLLGIPARQHNIADKFLYHGGREEINNSIKHWQNQIETNNNIKAAGEGIQAPEQLQVYDEENAKANSIIKDNQDFLKTIDEKFPIDKTLPPEMIGPGNQSYELLKHTLDTSKQRAKEIIGVQDSETEMPYHKLEFTDEAANNIINGEGQTAPGYKKGGSVKKIDTKSKNSDIMHQSLAQMRAEILRRKHG